VGYTKVSTVERLTNENELKHARIHPIKLLIAMKQYGQGHGLKGDNFWEVDGDIMQALDEAFPLSFINLKPLGKDILVAVDISGSMTANVTGVPNLQAREAAAAMALLHKKADGPRVATLAFGTESALVDISKSRRVDDVMRIMANFRQGTDLSQPFQWALKNNKKYDAIIVYTDNETWAGHTHPFKAWQEYQRRFPAAKAIMASTVSNPYMTNLPDDPSVLNIVGFDAAIPEVVENFINS
jgi:60 kDa SS-A/Ro ribonucleoprotein